MRRLTFFLLILALFVPGSASAEFVFQPNAVTLGVGPAMLQNGIGTTFFLAGQVDLGSFADRVVWDAGFHWWKKTETESFSFFGTDSEISTRHRDFVVTSGVKYLFPVSSEQWLPYARGGLGLNFVDVSAETTSGGTSTGEVSVSSTDLGIYLGGGTSFRASPSFLIGAEGVFNVTDADHFLLGVTASFPFGQGASAIE